MLQNNRSGTVGIVAPHAQASARDASLHYVSDAEPGIRRVKVGRGFGYRDRDNGRIEDRGTLDRIGRLAIPPAWTEVWISPDPKGHIQATGRDDRGRKQYRYHERWSACRDEAKFSSLAAFAEALPRLRRRIDADLRRHGLGRERVLASIVWLLDNTMIRIGNATYARDNESFGLTTLRQRHANVEGGRVRFDFKGKSGRHWKLDLVDRRIVRIVRQAQELPGQQLFQYIGDDGERRSIHSQDVNDYMREAIGDDFSSKHFRTWGGTKAAVALFAGMPLPDTERATRVTINRLVDQVAAWLGNTRTICRKCYIHPAVVESWREGTLADRISEARRSVRHVRKGMDREEMIVLKWLQAIEAN